MPVLKVAQELLDIIYPIGSIYLTVNNVNPQTLFGGTWEKIHGGYLYAVDSTLTNSTYTGTGTQSHKLTTDEMPSHDHNLFGNSNVGHAAGVDYWNLPSVIEGYNYGERKNIYTNNTRTLPTGGGQGHTHNVSWRGVFCWKRTA